jgi:hypothetical protein
MQIILDIATVLGGIAALLFFWDRFSTHRNLSEKEDSKLKHSQVTTLSKSPRFPTMSFCTICGIASGIIAGNFGILAFISSGFAAGLLVFVGGSSIGDVLSRGGFFWLCWVIVMGVPGLLIEQHGWASFSGFNSGVLLAIVGGIVGAISAMRMTRSQIDID